MSNNSAELEQIKLEIQKLSVEFKEERFKQSQNKKDQPWWITLTQILGIPALLILMFFNFTQSGQSIQNTEKAVAETAKIKTEEIKTRVEIQKLLGELSDQRTANLEEYQKQLDETLPKLEETINKLVNLKATPQSPLSEKFFLTFLLLWIVYHGLSLVFNIIEYLWNVFVNLLATSVCKFTEKQSKIRKKIINIMSSITPLMYPVVGIFRWSIELFVFTVLVLPFFDQVILAMGSTVKAKDIKSAFFNFEFTEAVQTLHTIISNYGS